MTNDGWKPLGGPMRPTPPVAPWWHFGLLGHAAPVADVVVDEIDAADLFDHIPGVNKNSTYSRVAFLEYTAGRRA